MITKKLEIKNPCGQDWNEMKPMQQGRYCGSCNHIIHDFSEMPNDELLQMLKSGKHSCGRFVKEQMGLVYSVQTPVDRKKYWAGIAAAIIAGMLQVNIGYSQTPTKLSKLFPRSIAFAKGNEEKPNANTQETKDTLVKKEKISFRIVDSDTKKPLSNVRVEMNGLIGTTDDLGRIDFELDSEESSNSRLSIKLFQSSYENQTLNKDITNCLNKLNILSMRRKKVNQDREFTLGYF